MSKFFPKTFSIFFLTVFILQLGCFILLLTLPKTALAERAAIVGNVNFTPQTPNLETELNYKFISGDPTTRNIAHLVVAIYKYAIGIVGILAAVVLMIGGVLWIVAGGNTTQIGEAKAWIGASLTGLILALTSYLILYTVNPALVNLQITDIKSVAEMKTGCCTTTDTTTGKSVNSETVDTDCKGNWQQGACPSSCCSYTIFASTGSMGGAQLNCLEKLSEDDCSKKSNINKYSYKPSGKCNTSNLCDEVAVISVTGRCTHANGVCENYIYSNNCKADGDLYEENKRCATSCCEFELVSSVYQGGRDCVEGGSLEECNAKPKSSAYIPNNYYLPSPLGMCQKSNDYTNKCVSAQ